MDVHNALNLDPSQFGDSAISEDTKVFNQKLQDLMNEGPKWYEVGAKRYREMRAAGETPLPGTVLLESAEDMDIPSRDSGRTIPCRIFRPQNEKAIKFVFLHIHGGGWVLQDQKSQDPVLQAIADTNGVLVFSVGYRLAPEYSFPAGPNDCYDAAEWLVDNAESKFGVSMGFVGGESAGAHLSVLVTLHLLQHSDIKCSSFKFKGLLLHFGCYTMIWTPQVYNFRKSVTLILDRTLMDHFVEAFLPGMSDEQKRDPSISPLYANLEMLRGRLPPALFTCGTEDCLLDDTMFMSVKWLMAGGEAVVKIVPGAPHNYIMFVEDAKASGADKGMQAVNDFIQSKLR